MRQPTTNRLRWVGRFIAVSVMVLLPAASFGQSQPFPMQRAGFVLSNHQFSPESGVSSAAFDFDGVVFGAALDRPGLYVSVARGSDRSLRAGIEGDVTLLDFNVRFQAPIWPKKARSRGEVSGFYLPITLESLYRKLNRDEGSTDFDVFDYTAVAVGPGAGYRTSGKHIRLEASVSPVFGLATRSFGSSFGRVAAAEAGLRLWTRPVIGRFGVSAGYSFRWQSWRVGGLDAFDAAGQGRVTYSGSGHGVTLGLAW